MNLFVNQTNYELIREKNFVMQKWLDENDILIYSMIKEKSFTMQKWLDENDILISSAVNEDKSVVAERFI